MSSPGTAPHAGWIARTIAVSATNPWLTVLFVAALALWGWYALVRSPLDAIPDLSDVQVIVFTEWPGQSPDIVEDQVTYPLAAALLAAPRVAFVRGQSMFGMSFLYVIFDDGTDLYWVHSRAIIWELSGRASMARRANALREMPHQAEAPHYADRPCRPACRESVGTSGPEPAS